jgi:hypothetical protein
MKNEQFFKIEKSLDILTLKPTKKKKNKLTQ